MELNVQLDSGTVLPALVLALGPSGAAIAAEVKYLFQDADPKRIELTHFLALQFQSEEKPSGSQAVITPPADKPDQFTLVSAEQAQQAGWLMPSSLQEGYSRLCAHSAELKILLQSQLDALRSHPVLVRTGYARDDAPPVNIIILADLWSLTDASALLPISYLLLELIQGWRDVMVHILLNVADFPKDRHTDLEKATFWSLLHDLEKALSSDHTGISGAFLQALKIKSKKPLPFNYYLFDRIMTGGRVIDVKTDLEVIVGNFMISLLFQDVSNELTKKSSTSFTSNEPYFKSAGSAIITFDPQPIINICATRLAAEYLAEDFGIASLPDSKVIDLARDQEFGTFGNLKNWLDQALEGQPYVVRNDTDRLRLEYQLHIEFSKLVFENARNTPWVKELTEYDVNFQEREQQNHLSQAIDCIQSLKSQILNQQADIINRLPQQARLYPGGVNAAIQLVEFWKKLLQANLSTIKIAEQNAVLPATARAIFEADLNNLLHAIQSFPSIPWVLTILPQPIKRFLINIYTVMRLRKSVLKLVELRDKVLHSLENYYCSVHEEKVWGQLLTAIQEIFDEAEDASNDLITLKNRVVKIGKELSESWGDMPLVDSSIREHSEFRQFPVNQAFLVKMFEKHKKSPDKFRQFVLTDTDGLLDNWRQASEDDIKRRLLKPCLDVFVPIQNYNLEDIINLSSPDQNDPLCKALSTLSRAAIPLANPHFDAIGNQYNLPDRRFMLLHDRNSADINACPKANAADWELISTGDPHLIAYSRVKMRFPLAALDKVSVLGEREYSGLTIEKQSDMHFTNKPRPASYKSSADSTDPDKALKTFYWTFKPKGSNNEFDQTIELTISRSRFEYYRRQPRYNGQWNLYAELDMPEVNDLAGEFQKLHARHKWNTFTQAYNVLKFIQSCIPYSYDKDTTGHEDWARYPIETLMECTGDCEDVAILCAAIIARLGFQTALFVYPKHVAFGVAGADNLKGDYVLDPDTGLRYFYGEATANGWHLGEIPKDYLNSPPDEILPVTRKIQEE